MISLSPDKSVTVIKARAGRVPLLIVLKPELQISQLAIKRFEKKFEYALEHYFAEN